MGRKSVIDEVATANYDPCVMQRRWSHRCTTGFVTKKCLTKEIVVLTLDMDLVVGHHISPLDVLQQIHLIVKDRPHYLH